MLTALVVADSAGARRRVATLLRLGGWEVHQAVGIEAALRLAGEAHLDLVVTDMVMRGGDGAALLHRLGNEGCTARSVLVASHLTEQVRDQAAAAGALACLAKPVDPRLFLDVMHVFTGRPDPRAGAEAQPVEPAPLRIGAERLDRVRDMYVNALPLHLSPIASSAREGDPAGTRRPPRALAGLVPSACRPRRQFQPDSEPLSLLAR